MRFSDLFVSHKPENFMHLTLQDGFWFVHILFISMVKFQFLVTFPSGLLSLPSCVLFSLY